MPRPVSPVRPDWVDPAVCSLEYRLKIIGRLPFFKHLPPDAIAWINSLFHDRDVAAGERVYHEGDDAGDLYLVALGKIKLVQNVASGRAVLLDILHGGDYFGTFAAFGPSTHTATAIAQTDCCILRITSADFESILAGHPEVTRMVLEAVTRRLAEAQELILQLSAYTVEQRIASTLLRLAGKLGEKRGPGVLIQLPFSRQDLASMTASTPETVSRTISRFAARGLVKTGRKWVTLTDIQGLEELVKKGAVN